MRRKKVEEKSNKNILVSRFTKRSEKKGSFSLSGPKKCLSVHFWRKSRLFPTEKRTLLVSLKEAKRRRTKRCRSERSRSRLSAGGGGGGALKRRVGVGVGVKRD